jgi:hypothetical protein
MNQTRRKKIKKAAKAIINKTAKEIARHDRKVASQQLDALVKEIFDTLPVPNGKNDPVGILFRKAMELQHTVHAGKLGLDFTITAMHVLREEFVKLREFNRQSIEADVAASFNNIEEGEIIDQDPDHDFDVDWGRCAGKAEGLELGIDLMERLASSFFLHEETEAAEAARQNYKILQEEWAKQQLRLRQFEWQQQNVKQGERKTP